MKLASWLSETWQTYFSNATAQRDFRVQLRGGRSVLLFSLYLGLLILVGMFVYSQTAGIEEISVVDAQQRLRGFYDVIMIILGAAVALISPALTATTVVMERQRKSLDLVFSAPVKPKYFLVGKMIGSYRYTWMLLVLALPVTATCVVLGGAAWSDVVVAYLLLSLQALILTSTALLMSTLAPKPVSAIVWSYAIAIVYLLATTIPGGSASYSPGAGREASFFSCLNPFFVTHTADTYSLIFGTEVPNWILVTIFAGLMSKLFVLTAGSILAPFGSSKEVPSLRVHVLAYSAALTLYCGYLAGGSTSMLGFGSGGSTARDWSAILGIALCWSLAPMFIFLPMLTCFGTDSEKRYWPNGSMSIRHMLDGTPAGALPFLWALTILNAGALVAGTWLNSNLLPSFAFYAYVIFALGFWTFFWAIGRITSSMFAGLRSARTLQFTAFVVLAVLPVPFLAAISSGDWTSDRSSRIWELYILRPLFTASGDRYGQALAYGLVMLVGGLVLGFVAERRIARRMMAMKATDGRTYATA